MIGYANPPIPGPGRAKGSKNKKVLGTDDLINLLNSKDYDPAIAQIDLARDPKCPHSTRHTINSDFMTLNILWDVTTQKTVSVEPTVDVIAVDPDSETDRVSPPYSGSYGHSPDDSHFQPINLPTIALSYDCRAGPVGRAGTSVRIFVPKSKFHIPHIFWGI
jgi:hypothetical protein